MRNLTALFLCFAALTACLCTVVRADTVPPAAIQARYSALISALKKLDLKTYDAFYAPEYVSVDPSGKTSHRAEYLAGIHDLLKDAKKLTFKIVYKSVKTHDGIVDVAFDARGTIFTSAGPMPFHEIGTDSWKKIGGAWREVKTVDKVFTITAPKTKAK